MNVPNLTVRLYGDACLREKCDPVNEVGVSERVFIEAMIATMREYKGVGLAAPQVGVIRQIFVVDIGDGPVAAVNPKIIERKGSAPLEEGCLSIPGVSVEVRRPRKIRVRYLDEHNRVVEKEYTDLMARVFLHETDHLAGKLIVSYADWRGKSGLKKQLQEIVRQSESHPDSIGTGTSASCLNFSNKTLPSM